MIFWIVGAVIVVLIVLWLFISYNRLVSVFERKENALNQISIEQKSRWDVMGELVKVVKRYTDYESSSLIEIVNARRGADARNPHEIQQDNDVFTEAMGQMHLLVERYPELKANEIYLQLIGSLNDYENKVRLSRSVYNDMVTRANQMVKYFPQMIPAHLFGFKSSDYLTFDSASGDMPDLGKV